LLALSALIKDEARVFSFVVEAENEAEMSSFDLPDECQVICLYRNGKFIIPNANFSFKAEDEVVILTHSRNLSYLNKLLLNESRDTVPVENKAQDKAE
jgi:trk system potassium uptake protein TrkA